jgi:hypothetical protein
MFKTSLYFKIRDTLDATSKHSSAIADLAESIQGEYESFIYYKKDAKGEVKELPCDTSTIRRTIRFCISLGLVTDEEKCALTDEGKRARNKDRFDYQLQQAVINFLEKSKLPMKAITDAIDTTLALPDVESLYQVISPELPFETFRACLFLLSVCGEAKGDNILKSYQRKLYLTDARIEEINKKKGTS